MTHCKWIPTALRPKEPRHINSNVLAHWEAS